MAVPFIDLSRTPRGYDDGLREAVLRVLDHRQFILGREVQGFEDAAAAYLGGDLHVVGASSGTDALLLGLMALDVGPGDEVITTPFSFFATAGVISRLGARPRFVDIDPVTYGIDVARLAEVPNAGAKALVPVHLFGHILDLDPFLAWADGQVPVMEDAAQALGSRDAQGRAGGTVGRLGAFSFFPTKNLGAMGDAGMVVTRDDALAARLRRLRVHGQSATYVHDEIGGNFRLDAIQAAALAVGLQHLDEAIAKRRANAARYEALIREAGLDEDRIVLPHIGEGHGAHQYVVRIPGGRRDEVQAALRERGIGSAVYYPLPFHLQPCFAALGYREGDFPEAERAAHEVLALPVFPGLTEAEQDEVVAALADLV